MHGLWFGIESINVWSHWGEMTRQIGLSGRIEGRHQMARIDLMFYSDGTGNVAFGKTAEEDQYEENDAGSDSTIVAHVTFEESDEDFREAVVSSLLALHTIECAGCAGDTGQTVFEKLVTEIFKAGVAFGKSG
jgi:hypothetical protein